MRCKLLQAKLDLIGIEFHSRMRAVEQIDSVDNRLLVVDENFNVVGAQEIEIYFVAIVADGRNERGVSVKRLHFFIERIFSQFSPRKHA